MDNGQRAQNYLQQRAHRSRTGIIPVRLPRMADLTPAQQRRIRQNARVTPHIHERYADENGHTQTRRCLKCRPAKRPAVAEAPQRLIFRRTGG